MERSQTLGEKKKKKIFLFGKRKSNHWIAALLAAIPLQKPTTHLGPLRYVLEEDVRSDFWFLSAFL